MVYYYLGDGDRLRRWIARDLEAGDDLLQRKYNWVKEHIFRGVEFSLLNTPIAVWNETSEEALLIGEGTYSGSSVGASHGEYGSSGS